MRPKNLEEKKQALEAYAAELAEEDNGAGKRGAKRAKKKRAAKTAVFSVTAALAAEGQSRVRFANHILRGYENFEQKLSRLGADIRAAED